MILPIAHVGHLLVDLPMFFGPVAVLVGWLVMTNRRAARQERADVGSARGERHRDPTGGRV